MTKRDIVFRKLASRLAVWNARVDQLPAGFRRRHAQKTQELLDRRESARIKVAKASRVRNERFFDACRECTRAFEELQKSWNSVVLRSGSS